MSVAPPPDEPGGPDAVDSETGPDADDVDEAGEESFPASDAPASWSGPPDT